VSWCNTQPFFAAANTSIAAGTTTIPPLGTDKNGQACPSSRSFTLVDACPSDNLPTQYLLLADNTTVQDTAANRAQFPDATVLDNASDEALLSEFIDPVIGCTPFQVASLDDPGAMVASLATQELQAGVFQQAPVARVALNDPDCLLTSNGDTSTAKTNAYRLGVNQGLLGNGANTDNGSLVPFCEGMIDQAPAFFQNNMAGFAGATTPDAAVGTNLFTFLCGRYLTSLMQLGCPETTQPVACQFNGAGACSTCTITLMGNATASGTTGSTTATTSAKASATAATSKGGGGVAGGATGGLTGSTGAAVMLNGTAAALNGTAAAKNSTMTNATALAIKERALSHTLRQFGRRSERRTRLRSEHAW